MGASMAQLYLALTMLAHLPWTGLAYGQSRWQPAVVPLQAYKIKHISSLSEPINGIHHTNYAETGYVNSCVNKFDLDISNSGGLDNDLTYNKPDHAKMIDLLLNNGNANNNNNHNSDADSVVAHTIMGSQQHEADLSALYQRIEFNASEIDRLYKRNDFTLKEFLTAIKTSAVSLSKMAGIMAVRDLALNAAVQESITDGKLAGRKLGIMVAELMANTIRHIISKYEKLINEETRGNFEKTAKQFEAMLLIEKKSIQQPQLIIETRRRKKRQAPMPLFKTPVVNYLTSNDVEQDLSVPDNTDDTTSAFYDLDNSSADLDAGGPKSLAKLVYHGYSASHGLRFGRDVSDQEGAQQAANTASPDSAAASATPDDSAGGTTTTTTTTEPPVAADQASADSSTLPAETTAGPGAAKGSTASAGQPKKKIVRKKIIVKSSSQKQQTTTSTAAPDSLADTSNSPELASGPSSAPLSGTVKPEVDAPASGQNGTGPGNDPASGASNNGADNNGDQQQLDSQDGSTGASRAAKVPKSASKQAGPAAAPSTTTKPANKSEASTTALPTILPGKKAPSTPPSASSKPDKKGPPDGGDGDEADKFLPADERARKIFNVASVTGFVQGIKLAMSTMSQARTNLRPDNRYLEASEIGFRDALKEGWRAGLSRKFDQNANSIWDKLKNAYNESTVFDEERPDPYDLGAHLGYMIGTVVGYNTARKLDPTLDGMSGSLERALRSDKQKFSAGELQEMAAKRAAYSAASLAAFKAALKVGFLTGAKLGPKAGIYYVQRSGARSGAKIGATLGAEAGLRAGGDTTARVAVYEQTQLQTTGMVSPAIAHKGTKTAMDCGRDSGRVVGAIVGALAAAEGFKAYIDNSGYIEAVASEYMRFKSGAEHGYKLGEVTGMEIKINKRSPFYVDPLKKVDLNATPITQDLPELAPDMLQKMKQLNNMTISESDNEIVGEMTSDSKRGKSTGQSKPVKAKLKLRVYPSDRKSDNVLFKIVGKQAADEAAANQSSGRQLSHIYGFLAGSLTDDDPAATGESKLDHEDKALQVLYEEALRGIMPSSRDNLKMLTSAGAVEATGMKVSSPSSTSAGTGGGGGGADNGAGKVPHFVGSIFDNESSKNETQTVLTNLPTTTGKPSAAGPATTKAAGAAASGSGGVKKQTLADKPAADKAKKTKKKKAAGSTKAPS